MKTMTIEQRKAEIFDLDKERVAHLNAATQHQQAAADRELAIRVKLALLDEAIKAEEAAK